MGNSQSNHTYTYKNSVDESIIRKNIIQKHLNYMQTNKKINNKNKNHLINNPEIQNTFLNNKKKKKKLFNHLNSLSLEEKKNLKSNNYNSVNGFLNDLNLDGDLLEVENKKDLLYLNQGERAQNNIKYEKSFLEKEKDLEKRFQQEEIENRNKFKMDQENRRHKYKSMISNFKTEVFFLKYLKIFLLIS